MFAIGLFELVYGGWARDLAVFIEQRLIVVVVGIRWNGWVFVRAGAGAGQTHKSPRARDIWEASAGKNVANKKRHQSTGFMVGIFASALEGVWRNAAPPGDGTSHLARKRRISECWTPSGFLRGVSNGRRVTS